MKDSTAIWCESEPGKKDFSPLEINYGEFSVLTEINALMETKQTLQIILELV